MDWVFISIAKLTDKSKRRTTVNFAGPEFLIVRPHKFTMGSNDGSWDEKPAHAVKLTRPILFATRQVTNAEYERIDPKHKRYRGAGGDGDPVRFVTWLEANAYCVCLSILGGKTYRLPTEAEWEYVARIEPTLVAGEEWCLDWYGPYLPQEQTNPIGYATGDCRVVRGGYPSRRLSDLPDDRNAAVGFRVVQADLPVPLALPAQPTRLWQTGVSHAPAEWVPPVDPAVPYFAEPIPYVHMPADSHGPLFSKHNHDPGISYCDNGDLIAVWYSTEAEHGRELVVAAARLRKGADRWDDADLFWDVAGRNDHAPAIWNDGAGTLSHFNGLSSGEGWNDMIVLARTSRDDGVTWSPARIIAPIHENGNQPVFGVFRRSDGAICLPCDAEPGPEGGTILHVGADDGGTWSRSDDHRPPTPFVEGGAGPRIAGIHAAVDRWTDGSIVALGRGNDIDGRMPMSVSGDGGFTWTYSASPFPPLGGGQRAALRTLREGVMLFVSFTPGTEFVGGEGRSFEGKGMFSALSYDGGRTWSHFKLITDGVRRTLDGRGWTHEFTMDASNAEPMGYLAAVQTPDGVVNLVSSGVCYRFNLAWLLEPNVGPRTGE